TLAIHGAPAVIQQLAVDDFWPGIGGDDAIPARGFVSLSTNAARVTRRKLKFQFDFDMALLDVRNLMLRFGGLTAGNRVDLAIERDSIFSIIGPNGAGKTTLFNAITGIYLPTSGSILFFGEQLKRPLRAKVVIVCVLIGVLTALAAVTVSANVDNLWN